MGETRNINHWVFEGFKQRMTTKEWKAILLEEEDIIFVHGRMRHLKAKSLGSGVVEVYKQPLED